MVRKPYKIDTYATQALNKLLKTYGIQIPKDYGLFVTNTVRGRTCYKNKNITVPIWAVKQSLNGKTPGYDVYYACHEIAHAMAPATKGDVHGPKFMAAFINICPKQYQHYELEYKPRLAKAAGIKNVSK